ncbi:MAG: DUF72 domain-containing protein [Chthoniobacteraceae bacterium]
MNAGDLSELPVAPDVRFGTCAWSFDDWRGVFYPEHLASNQRLGFYSTYFDSVEVDSTFYAPPSVQTAGNWLDATPDDFLFSCKVSREITHDHKLRKCEELLATFLASIAPLRRKLACVLIQLPGYFTLREDELALREFVHQLPHAFRFAIEFRDESWHLPRIAHLLEEHRVCWVWNDTTTLEHQTEGAFDFCPITTDFLYLRLMGDLKTKYREDGEGVFRYRELLWPRDSALESWAIRVKQHAEQVSRVLVYANNHYEGFAPLTCRRAARQFGRELAIPNHGEAPPKVDDSQLELF